ncbi:Hypp3851 [Branchiostoma lanceolatum]|uniref:Hypp3851 protein n=1 Tax=Branchiostoma lanceolatum TaxID=7740 RepID=A0A8K0A477_BRALA|nr:Hypp3851 [Branchiostoma lanceolatum]
MARNDVKFTRKTEAKTRRFFQIRLVDVRWPTVPSFANIVLDYLEAADSCYKCDDEVAKLHERISNQTRVISEMEKIVETLRLRIEDLVDRVNGTENFIAHPGTAFYNYLDEIAQASCSALARTPHYVWAVPRDCHGDGKTCDQACASAGQSLLSEVGRGDIECFDAFQVRKTDLGLRTYHYLQDGGCSWRANHCGPNYCCCRKSN